KMASGIFGPSAARAKMNTVSVGATFAASDGARLTVPAILACVAACALATVEALAADDATPPLVAPSRGAAAAICAGADPAAEGKAASCRASAMLESMELAIGELSGTFAFVFSQ